MMPDAEKTPPPNLSELSAFTGDDIGAQFVDELRVTNDAIVRGRGGDLSVYDQIYRDDQVYSCFKQLRAAITSREWQVEPGGDQQADLDAAADLKEHLNRIGFDAVSKRMLMGIWYGYSVGECMFATDESHVTLDQVLVRKARRFGFDKDFQLRLLRLSKPQGIVMPPQKFWVLRADSEDDDDPYPLGLGHYCYWPVWFKRNSLRFWALWSEKFASPTPVAKVPPGSNDTERSRVLRLLKAIISGGQLVIPNNVAVELLEALARAGDDYERLVRYLDGCIAKIILSQTMTTDSGSSRSQAEVHAGVKLEVVKGYGDLLCESFNTGPARWLTAWNYPGAAAPRVWRDYSEASDLAGMADVDTKLFGIGFRPTAERIQTVYGSDYERVVQGKQPGSDTSSPAGDPDPAFAEPDPDPVVGPVAAALESVLGDGGWERIIGPQVSELAELIGDASTLDEARERLGSVTRDPATLTDSLARVMFAARLAGTAGAEVESDGD